MYIIGIDLSGPSNHQDTVLTSFIVDNHHLTFDNRILGASDEAMISFVSSLPSDKPIFIGIDSPLSYQDGGGDRPYDRELRRFAKGLGMKSGSIMTPTLTRMIYLTARGIHLAHTLSSMENVNVTEVHPGVALASRVPADEMHHVLHYKKRDESLDWVQDFLSTYISRLLPPAHTSHEIDSILAAIACWHWATESNIPWCMGAKPPHHPFPITV
ncbi:DUF429 domain-containing protein [Halobacillus salinus]|uniref:DUF429 domain-containing protein n=1 Tax=Halobacillus salinus TaxID=192814 RepID=A0A4Z0GY19_9BACI|nr:DUF429 domain-containing protein [Halobacillus salinus]TGB02759.1 DUF429 domain-containing protein [Halobacillus salinus]